MTQTIRLAVLIAGLVSQKTCPNATAKIKKVGNTLLHMILQLSFVELAMSSTYSLTGFWLPIDFLEVVNKTVAFIMLSECVFHLIELFMAALRYNKFNTACSSPEDVELLEEGMNEKDFVHTSVRMVNWTYSTRLLTHQVFIASNQIASLLAVSLLLFFSLVSMGLFFLTTCRYSVFKSKLTGAWRIILEISLVFFFGKCLAERSAFYSGHTLGLPPLTTYIDGIVLAGFIACLSMQLIEVLIKAVYLLKDKVFCRRPRLTQHEIAKTLKETQFASVYLQMRHEKFVVRNALRKSKVSAKQAESKKKKVSLRQLRAEVGQSTEILISARCLISRRDEAITHEDTPVLSKFTRNSESTRLKQEQIPGSITSLCLPRSSNMLSQNLTETPRSLKSATPLRALNPVLAALRVRTDKKQLTFQPKALRRRIKITGYTSDNRGMPSVEVLDLDKKNITKCDQATRQVPSENNRDQILSKALGPRVQRKVLRQLMSRENKNNIQQ